MTPAQLSDAIARASWHDLLPAHRLDEGTSPVGAPTCVEMLDIGTGHHLAVATDEDGHAYPVPLTTTSSGGVRRSRAGDGTCEALLATLRAGTRRSGGFELTSWHDEPCAGERAITVDQTNESIVIGDAAVLKWTFRLVESPAPDLLTALHRHGFDGMPRPWGLVQWHPAGGGPSVLVASIVSYVSGAVDGWTWAVDDLHSDVAVGHGHRLEEAASAVGRLVADLHVALGHSASTATASDTCGWNREAEADLAAAVEVSSGTARTLLENHEGAIRAILADVTGRVGTPLVAVHGDLHVGQVLRAGEVGQRSYVVTDFDGNPVVPPDERRRPQPAALDVAGMAQSLAHVGIVLQRRDPTLDPRAVDALATNAVDAFLAAYVDELSRRERSSLFDPALVRAFRLRQVCREFIYAATHLPRWSYVPEAALPALLSPGDLR